MRIGGEIHRDICFFYASEEDGKRGDSPIGTGFFIWTADEDRSRTHTYVVTCDHLVQSSAPLHFIRYNRPLVEESPVVAPLSGFDWTSHPAGDDVAVCYLGLRGFSGPTLAGASQFLTVDDLEVEVDLGDACLMVGCFAPHPGKSRNVSALRFGNVSMLPHEPIYINARNFDQTAFLVEMRSRGGYSGSPVYLLPHESGDRHLRKTLGICCGHMLDQGVKTGVVENAGMAIVIPAWKITEILRMPDVIAARRAEELRRDEERRQVVTWGL